MFEAALKTIATANYATLDTLQTGLFSQADLEGIRAYALQKHTEGRFVSARVGPQNEGREAKRIEEIRGDQTFWPELSEAPLTRLEQVLEMLKTVANQKFFLGCRDFEGHFALYPPGTFYSKHLDVFRTNTSAPTLKRRILSFVLYLNPEWTSRDGGELVLYTSVSDLRILPAWGRLVLFLSAEVPHEVLSSQKDRLSFTGWFFA